MDLKSAIKAHPMLKYLTIRLLMPRNQARPRLWVKLFLNPFKHKRGRHSRICRRTRLDVMPFNAFTLGKDSTIEDFTTINNGVGDVIIGERTRVGIGDVIIGPAIIGNDVMIAQHVVISGLNHGYQNISVTPHNQPVTKQLITIGDESWIGANSVVVAGVTVGKHSVIAAGSVVTKDIPPFSVAAGNPAKVIKHYNSGTGQWEKV